MSKAEDPAQQHPVGPSIVEVVPSTTAGGASEFEKAVRVTKKVSIAIIVVHIIALAAYGWYFFTQIILTVFALIVGSVVLCTSALDKCGYVVVAALYSLGVVGDVWRVIEWFLFIEYVNEDSYDYGSQYDSADDDDAVVGWVMLFASPTILGAVLFLVGAVFAFKAARKWQQGSALPI